MGALGIVYGDIGTSPLYAINKIFFGLDGFGTNPQNIYGGISLVIWTLTIVISFKYLIFVLRADNEGEGGMFALYGLINKYKKIGIRSLMVILMLAAGLLLGDGMITPAISVLSAVEGLSVATPFFEQFIVLITILILTLLFAIQQKGTAKVGSIFGPIIFLWFIALALLGLEAIIAQPAIFNSFNPIYGINFLKSIGWYNSLLVLGAVMLVITGGEALYADMGHFGKRPIRLTWFSLVYPVLIINYLGQGAYLLSGQPIAHGNIFYSMVPQFFLYPMIILATLATIIASQALISGVFSLVSQAVALDVFPRLRIIHTHAAHEGQIYIPSMNWALYIGCVLLVIFFGSSSNLASAYGLAVAGVMLATSLAMFVVARFSWNWNFMQAIFIFGIFTIVDLAFVFANSLKIFTGGFVPLIIAAFAFAIMVTWRWGRRIIHRAHASEKTITVGELITLKNRTEHFIDRSVVIMAHKKIESLKDSTPALTRFFTERYGLLPKNLIFLNIITKKVSHIRRNRCRIKVFQREPGRGSIVSITMLFGFMENPNVEAVLEGLANHHKVNLPADPANWLVHVASDQLVPSRRFSLWKRLQLNLFLFLRRNSMPAYHYYGLGKEVNLSMEIMPIKVG